MVTMGFGGLSPNRRDLGTPNNDHKYDTPCDPVNTYIIYQAFLHFKNIIWLHLHARKYDFNQRIKRMTFPALISTKITSAEGRRFTNSIINMDSMNSKSLALLSKVWLSDPNLRKITITE